MKFLISEVICTKNQNFILDFYTFLIKMDIVIENSSEDLKRIVEFN